jgi:hypothetical protein
MRMKPITSDSPDSRRIDAIEEQCNIWRCII